ncbi:hypothetical protein AUJ46_01140 [Candidatus Peregrinibacteria bacterium CG1_02_54_53]|nr:MAG: hypothetical protein AUJ46_01140 [Candidatus Peregrinibacteria bacterium CG1_02_54_53]
MNEQPVQIGTQESDTTIAVPVAEHAAIETAITIDEKRRERRSILWVFLIFLCVHLFMFRGVLVKIPDIFAGKAVLNTSELVPFFDPSTQLFEQAGGKFSELTNGPEFRVRYSILTTWMRYYLILPFAVVFSPLVGAFLAFLVVYAFLRKLIPDVSWQRILHGTAVSTLLIELILLPAKLTHFYTLILGFYVFTIAIVLLLTGIFVEQRRPIQKIFAASVIMLLNPGVHYLVLYPITVALLFVSIALVLLVARQKKRKPTSSQSDIGMIWKRLLAALFCTLLFTVIPYALFVKSFVLQGITDLSDLVPDTFQAIRTSSLSLLNQLTFSLGSVSDNNLIGQYVSSTPRYGKIFYSLVVFLPFFIAIPCQDRSHHRIRLFLGLIAGPLFFAMWCSLGYTSIQWAPTFHQILAALFNRFYLMQSPLAEAGGNIISQIIHVLRFPHRFQFIYLAIVSILMPLGIITLRQSFHPISSRLQPRVKTTFTCLLTLLFFVPLLAHWEDRVALISGDVGGLVRPYNLNNIREIKDVLSTLPRDRIIVLPSSDANWTLQDPGGGEYKFIDKFYIYFLNRPSYYSGATGEIQNKYYFFLMMQSLLRNDLGWINVLRNLKIHYLIINKELQWNNPDISQFLQQVGRFTVNQPRQLPQFLTLLKENESFALYEFIDPQSPDAQEVLMDIDWSSFVCLQRNPVFSKEWKMRFLNSVEMRHSSGSLTVLSNNREKTLLDWFAISHPAQFVRPDPTSFAFNADHVPSSQYFNTPASMFNFLTTNKYNSMSIIFPGPFDTITTSFVGLPKKTTIRFPIAVNESGTYELFLRGMTTMNRLSFQIDHQESFSVPLDTRSSPTHYVLSNSASFGKKLPVDVSGETPETVSKSIPNSIAPVTNTFSYTSLGVVALHKGQRWLHLIKQDDNPLVVEGILLFLVKKSADNTVIPPEIRLTDPEGFSATNT